MSRQSTLESGLRVYPDSFKTKVAQLANETLDSLQAIWREAGYEDVECQGLLGDLLHKIKVTCATELAAEQQILEHAKAQVLSTLDTFNCYSIKLGRKTRIESSFGVNYTDKLANLEKEMASIEIEVNQRQEILDGEYNKIKNFLDALGEEVPPFESFSGPSGTPELSDVRLRLLREYFSNIGILKTHRAEEMQKVAEECREYMMDMEITSEGWDTMEEVSGFSGCNEALAKFVKFGKFDFGLHKDNLEILKLRCSTLLEEKVRRRDELARLGTEIARLWTLLRIPSAEREQFQASFKMNLSMETLAKGHDELERLYTVRATSLKKVIASIRADIFALWEECGITELTQQRIEFAQYFDNIDCLEDSAVEEHEEYCNILKARVEELRPILSKISKREIIINERIELEHLQLNPERLIARGPNAREERKREEGMNLRVKNLEKFTKEILTQIQSWEEMHGPFVYSGERYHDRVINQEEQYVEIRDSLRNSRKKKDAPKVETIPAKAPSIVRKPTATTNTISSASLQLNGSLSNKLGSLSMDLSSLPHDENFNDRNSTDSNNTDATEVRDRQSSATVVKQYHL